MRLLSQARVVCYRNPFEPCLEWGLETDNPMATAYRSRNNSSGALIVVSTGFFLLAVLFSLIGGDGFYLSLALLVLGCFSMIVVGIMRESHVKAAAFAAPPAIQESDEF